MYHGVSPLEFTSGLGLIKFLPFGFGADMDLPSLSFVESLSELKEGKSFVYVFNPERILGDLGCLLGACGGPLGFLWGLGFVFTDFIC